MLTDVLHREAYLLQLAREELLDGAASKVNHPSWAIEAFKRIIIAT